MSGAGDTRPTPERVEKPWGHELIWARTDRYVGKILHIDAGASLSYQYHERKEETVFVLSGRLEVHWSAGDDEPERLVLEQGSVFHVRPGVRHRFASGGGPVDIIEASSPELDDLVRLWDPNGRPL